MTKVLFLQNVLVEHTGTMYLSTALKRAGHDCDLLVQSYENDIIKSAVSSDADIIAFSCTTSCAHGWGMHNWALRVAEELKKRTSKITLFGGPHATFFPEIINKPQVDIVCLGEGEEAIVELADKLQHGEDITKIKNLWVKKEGRVYKNPIRPLVENLDCLGYPDREVYYKKYGYLKNSLTKRFMASRGCPYNCAYCFNTPFRKLYKDKGKFLRRRTVEHIINEIKQVKTEYPLKNVLFIDDVFVLDPHWVKRFTEAYKSEINLPFTCLIEISLANEDIIRDLHNGGCKQVIFGIESGNDFLRNKILKKSISKKQIIKTARLLKKYKIRFKTYSIFGLPEETLENAWETVHINQKIKADYLLCSLLQPIPKTEIYNYLSKNGFISGNISSENQDISCFPDSKVTDKREIINLQRLFFYAVKFPSLEPLIRKLIRLKPNKIFDIVSWIAYAYVDIRVKDLKIFDLLIFGLRNKELLRTKRGYQDF